MGRPSGQIEGRQEFAQLWRAAEPAVSACVYAAITEFHDAKDVIQQGAQEAARRFGQYDPARPFVGWALGIARSRVSDFCRRKKRDRCALSAEYVQRRLAMEDV